MRDYQSIDELATAVGDELTEAHEVTFGYSSRIERAASDRARGSHFRGSTYDRSTRRRKL
jgi:hypothetical protein